MSRYETRRGHLGSAETYSLVDTEAGLEATVVPEVGSNLISIQLKGLDASVLYGPGSLAELKSRPTGFGFPVLMPPNRISRGEFTIDGIRYVFPINREDYHIHGLVADKAWRVTSIDSSESAGCSLVTSLDSADYDDIGRTYPQRFRLSMIFTVQSGRVLIKTMCENLDERPLPFGIGYHPYFRTPMGSGSSKNQCFIQLNAAQRWELVNCFPTGVIGTPSGASDLRRFRPVTDLKLDDVYGSVDSNSALIEDRGLGLRTRFAADGSYPIWVVWTGRTPADPFVCLEPYSCVTNAFNLQMDPEVTGLRMIRMGQPFRGSMSLSFERI